MDNTLFLKIIGDARALNTKLDYTRSKEVLISLLEKELTNQQTIEVCKVLCLVERKMGNYAAYKAIEKATNIARNDIEEIGTNNVDSYAAAIETYAICLMNQGVIFDQQCIYSMAIPIYRKANDLFRQLYFRKPENPGVLINSLYTLGMALFNDGKMSSAKEIFEESLLLLGKNFDGDREQDERYGTIISILRLINNSLSDAER